MQTEGATKKLPNDTIEVVRALDRLGRAYAEAYLAIPAAESYPRRATDWRDGLGFFLDRAFEHAGSSPDFRRVGLRALKDTPLPQLGPESCDVEGLARSLWMRFCALGGFDPETGKGSNAKLNPLSIRNGETRENAIAVCATLKEHGGNLYKTVLEELRIGRIEEAHLTLKRIRGVSDKVASLVLRDVGIENAQDLPAAAASDPYLQPVDRWVIRVVDELKGENELSTARACIELANAAEASPLLVNAGAWYLGSHIAQGMFLLRQALRGLSDFRQIVVSHAGDLRREAQFLRVLFEGDLRKGFLDDLRSVWSRSDLTEEDAMELAQSELTAHRSGS